MDIISINLATNRTIAKLKNEGIESLTLIGADGKQYELTVNAKGSLNVTVKGGGSSGGSSGEVAEQLIVEFSRYGEYPSASIGEVEFYQVSEQVPTYKQFEQAELWVNYSESEHKLILTDTNDNGDMWSAYFRGEYMETGDFIVAVIPNANSGIPAGVYVNFNYIESQIGTSFDSGRIIFPEVSA